MRRSDFFWGKKIGNGIGVTVLRVRYMRADSGEYLFFCAREIYAC